MTNQLGMMVAGAVMAIGFASGAQAQCVGNCGTTVANGDVVAPPGGGTYNYVTTFNGESGGGTLGLGDETTGSQNNTAIFEAEAGSVLTFNFNYITSDGAGFADYGWAQLQNSSGVEVATLFTARTTPTGDTVPGFGLPVALLATLTPASTPIIIGTGVDGGPLWSQLGPDDTGQCFDAGCGFTGWIQAQYTIADAGFYRLAFGVTNWSDNAFASGLAYTGVFVDGTPVGAIPEPASWAMLIAGFGLVGAAARRRRSLHLA